MRQRRHFRPFLISLLCLSAFLALNWSVIDSQQSVASAHAFVIGSDPVDGSTISTAPSVVKIFFDAPIGSASIAHIFGPDGQNVNAAQSNIPSTNPQELDTPLVAANQLPEGSYLVRWTALGSVDGHATSGVIGFNIGHSSTGLSGQTILGPSTSNTLPELSMIGVMAIAWEWLVMMAMTFWIGIVVTEGLILTGVERAANLLNHTRKKARPLQWLCLTALLVGECITLILRATLLTQALNGSGINLDALQQIVLETDYGHLWLARIAILALALGGLWWTTRQPEQKNQIRAARQTNSRYGQLRQRITQELENVKKQPVETLDTTNHPVPSKRYTIASLVMAGLILFTLALSGDAAQVARPHISAIVLDWLYMAAQCIWLGSLTYLGYVILPLLRVVEPDPQAETLIALLKRFAPLILTVLGILLVSGLFLTEASISNPQQFITHPYGRALLVKILLIALMFMLTIYALYFLRPKLTRQTVLLPVVGVELPARRARQSALEQTERALKNALSIQSWMGAAVLLCAALMAFYAPPIVFPDINYATINSPSTTNTNTTPIQTQKVADLTVTLQLLPGRVNSANTLIFTLTDTNGRPVTDATVIVNTNMELMDMGTTSLTIAAGNPVYSARFEQYTTFNMSGLWDIHLNIQRTGQLPVQAIFKVTLAN